jgi:hypothetical protein
MHVRWNSINWVFLCVNTIVEVDVVNAQIMCYTKFCYNNPMNPSNPRMKFMKGILFYCKS